MFDFKKIAAEREKREEALYGLEESYAPFSATCEKCLNRKELLDAKEKKKLGLSVTDLAWRCNNCDEITEATSHLEEQTDGFAEMNNATDRQESIIKDGFDIINKIEEDKNRKIRE